MNICGEEDSMYTRERRISANRLLSGLVNSRTSSREIFSNFPGPSHWKEYSYESQLSNMGMKEQNWVPLACHCQCLSHRLLCSICLLSLLCLMNLWLLQGEPGKWEDSGIKMTTLGTCKKGPGSSSFLCCPGCFSKMVVVLVVW